MIKPGPILAFDTARVVGWAAAADGARPVWGSVQVAARGADLGEWLAPMFDLANDLITQHQPAVVGFISPIFTPQDNALRLQQLFGLTSVIALVVKRRADRDLPELRLIEASDSTIIKFFTGQNRWPGATRDVRRARKKQATMDACRRHGWEVGTDHDAADALAALCYFENQLFPAIAVGRGMAGPLFSAA